MVRTKTRIIERKKMKPVYKAAIPWIIIIGTPILILNEVPSEVVSFAIIIGLYLIWRAQKK